jgi:hypothetical protein
MVRWLVAATAAVVLLPASAVADPPNPRGPLWPWHHGVFLPLPTTCHGTASGRTVCSVPGGGGFRHGWPPR